MRKRLNRLFGDVRFVVIAVSVISGVILYLLGIIELPKKVEALEEKGKECQSAVDKLANSVETMRQVQEAKMESQEKIAEARVTHQAEMNQLLLKWIQEARVANGKIVE